MITLGYMLRSAPPSTVDLREAGESDFHYNLFLGDIIFCVDDRDLSARWGWIPIVDFAVCLHRIAEDLKPGQTQSFEFTESEHSIDFALRNGAVEIQATYGTSIAKASREDLQRCASDFLRRVLEELSASYPSLAQNPNIRRMYPKSVLRGK